MNSGAADFILFVAGLAAVLVGSFLAMMAGIAYITRGVEDIPHEYHPPDDGWYDKP